MPNLPTARKTPQGKKRRSTRQYALNSTTWRKIRKHQLQVQPLCVDCESAGRTTPANTVDHIDGNAWNNSADNLQSMCIKCHTIKTNEHDGGLGNRLDRL